MYLHVLYSFVFGKVYILRQSRLVTEKMVNGSLNEYVRLQLQRGYTPEAIRATLLQAGYNPQDIDFALRVARPVEKKILLTGKNAVFVLAGVLAIALLIFAGVLLFKPAAKDISISMSLARSELLPGDTISITTTFSSEQKRTVPVALDYVVSEKFTRRSITSRRAQINVGASAVETESIPLPTSVAPGDYEVKLVARFEQLTRVSSVSFTILQPPSGAVVEEKLTEELRPIEETPTEGELPCPETCDDLNPATDDICVRGACEHILKANYCGNGECEPGENKLLCPEDCGTAQDKTVIIHQALEFAKTNTEKAATLCNSLMLPQDADPCFAAIANASRKSALCANVQDVRARDNCLWEFTNYDDYSVCEQMSNKYLMTSCLSLARFSTLSKEQKEAEKTAQELQQEMAAE